MGQIHLPMSTLGWPRLHIGSAWWTVPVISRASEIHHFSEIRIFVQHKWKSGLVAATLKIQSSGKASAVSTCSSMVETSHPQIITIGKIPHRHRVLTHLLRMSWDHGLWFPTLIAVLGLAKRPHHCHLTMELLHSYGVVRSLALFLIQMVCQHTSPMVLISNTLEILPQQDASGRLDGLLSNQSVISPSPSLCEHIETIIFSTHFFK